MRPLFACAFAWVLTGCELVFPLASPDPDAAIRTPVFVSLDVDAPLVDTATATTITTQLTADPGSSVYLRFTATDGTLGDPPTTELFVPATGLASVTIPYAPPGLPTHTKVTCELSYEQTFEHPVSRDVSFDVVQISGTYGPRPTTVTLSVDTLYASAVNVSQLGQIRIGVYGTTNLPFRLGLYASSGGAPTDKLADVLLPETMGRTEADVGLLPAGDYWVAMLFSNFAVIDATGGMQPRPDRLRVLNPVFGPMPDLFDVANATMDTVDYSLYVIVTP